MIEADKRGFICTTITYNLHLNDRDSWKGGEIRSLIHTRLNRGMRAYTPSLEYWLIYKGYITYEGRQTVQMQRKLNAHRVAWARALADEYEAKGM